MKLIENDGEHPLKHVTTVLVDLGNDKFGDPARYRVRIFSDEKEKRWFAIRGVGEGSPSFCFEATFKADVIDQAETALKQYERFKRKRRKG